MMGSHHGGDPWWTARAEAEQLSSWRAGGREEEREICSGQREWASPYSTPTHALLLYDAAPTESVPSHL